MNRMADSSSSCVVHGGAPRGTYVRKVFERGGLGLDLDADCGSFQGKVFKANKLIQPVHGALLSRAEFV